jgi:hypothetical protein
MEKEILEILKAMQQDIKSLFHYLINYFYSSLIII